MDISNTRLKELLNKYLAGTASEEEVREVDDWYQSFGDHAGLTEQLSPGQRAALEQLLFLRISGDIAEAAPAAKVIRGRFRYWWAAAGIVLLLGAAYLAMQRTTAPVIAPVAMVIEKADSGAIKKIALPDGTVIWLNFGSQLRYPQQEGREVWLEGEAYFEVAPQQGKHFLVHSGKLDVQVLGTSFNVDAYAPGESVTVTVASGKVAVGNEGNKGITLNANQQALYQAAADKIEKYEISAADFSAWRQGQLVFRKTSFRSIGRKLEHRYNVQIRFDTAPTADALLTARFDSNVALKDILGMLCDIYGFSYRQEPGGKEYLIYDNQRR